MFKVRAGIATFLSFLGLSFLYIFPSPISAYYTFMPGTVVVGQPDFTSNTAGLSQSVISQPQDALVIDNKLVVAEFNNNRVLIWNSIPTSNGVPADVVLGQPDFTSNTANNGGRSASSLSAPTGLAAAGSKLLVSDRNNNRVLIWNSVPTTNKAAADVVVGQTDFSVGSANQGGAASAQTINQAERIASDGTKLFVADRNNNRVLIWNSIPTQNNTAADVVLGQPSFSATTGNNGGRSAISLNTPNGIATDGQRLYTTEDSNSNNRVLIWNQIPTINRAPADVVVGQPNFSSGSANQGGTVKGNTLSNPLGVAAYDNRLFIADRANRRILIFNSIPTQNNVFADMVIGQPDFTSNTTNNGGLGAQAIGSVLQSVKTFNNNLLLSSDDSNNRVVIYRNFNGAPGVSLNDTPQIQANGLIRMTGDASVAPNYFVASVQYSVNGGSWNQASASSGSYGAQNVPFYFDFDPNLNPAKDEAGNVLAGYTVQVKAINNNNDVTDHLFYFSPFVVNGPANNAVDETGTPTFDFSVNRQRTTLRDNLQKYQILVRPIHETGAGEWQTLIDEIPVDFASNKNSAANILASKYDSISTNNGDYETTSFKAIYSDESSRVKVYSKTNQLSGAYEWKVVAMDKTGHVQLTPVQTLFASSNPLTSFNPGFPLAVTSISGFGNPNMSTNYLAGMKKSYTISSTTPTFSGIAFAGSTITATFMDQKCATSNQDLPSCLKTVTTTTDANSKFKLTVPRGTLKAGTKYSTKLNVKLNNNFNQLPLFTLHVSTSR